jgi:hypothetical protein
VPRLPTPEDPTSLPTQRLFVERVQAVSSPFALDTTNAQTIDVICHRVDGTPLAIELVAARINILTPHTLLARPARRLPLASSGSRRLADCHHALRNMLAWSAELLGSAERCLLQRVAVFANDWTLEAAEAVCADAESTTDCILDQLGTLVESSLVQRVVSTDGPMRFSMLETIREYALEGLEAVRAAHVTKLRHLEWCVSVVQPLRPRLPDLATVGRPSGTPSRPARSNRVVVGSCALNAVLRPRRLRRGGAVGSRRCLKPRWTGTNPRASTCAGGDRSARVLAGRRCYSRRAAG